LIENAGLGYPIRKADLRSGDYLLVSTENSIYSIQVLEDSSYRIRGGWFDRNGLSPAQAPIAGCTWGGSAIKTDIVAACGLHLEFGNRVVTSRIREVRVFRVVDDVVFSEPSESDGAILAEQGIRWTAAPAVESTSHSD
jgi:hypothetical protein